MVGVWHTPVAMSPSSRVARISRPCANRLLIESEAHGNTLIKPVKVTDDPLSAGTPDLIIFAVKLWDTEAVARQLQPIVGDRKSTRLNSSHGYISYAVFCLF